MNIETSSWLYFVLAWYRHDDHALYYQWISCYYYHHPVPGHRVQPVYVLLVY